MSGEVTPLDATGFPVTISEPGSYSLSGNLTVRDASTTAVQFTADNVSLDLNGFTISGPNVCTPNPTRCTFAGAGNGVMEVAPTGVVSPATVRVMNGWCEAWGGHRIRLIGHGTLVQNVISMSNNGPELG